MFIPIDMMHYLSWQQFSSELFFGYISMFMHSMKFRVCVGFACSFV